MAWTGIIERKGRRPGAVDAGKVRAYCLKSISFPDVIMPIPFRHLVLATFPALVLSACASLGGPALATGATEAEVLARLGRPTHVYQDSGSRLLEYMRGPMGQTTEMARIGPDGRLQSFEQVLTMEKFATIVPGQTRQEQVLRAVGAPSEIRFYRNVGMNGWNYPFKESNTWDSMMTIYVDDAGLVQRMENGPDPRRMPSDSGRN